MALVATHLGVVEEERINRMSYIFFEDVLEELGHKLSYEAIVNYAGNSFVEKSWDMIMDSNPMMLNPNGKRSGSQNRAFADFFSQARVVEPGSAAIPKPQFERKGN